MVKIIQTMYAENFMHVEFMIEDLKIIVLTVDCWNDKGANTMSSLFSWVKPSNLSNIYIRSDLPTSKKCDLYFQIIENNVIRSIFNKNINTGKIVLPTDKSFNDDIILEKKRYAKYKIHRPYIFLLLRELLWKLGRWNSKELNRYLKNFNPDIVVYPYEGYIHFNRIVRHVIKVTGAKSIGYFWDDNFSYKQYPFNFGFYFYRFFQKADIKKTLTYSDVNFAISPKTKKEVDHVFGIKSILLTKPIFNLPDAYTNYIVNFPIRILYTGNLGIGRMSSINLLVQALKIVNNEKLYFILDVYTNTMLSDEEKDYYNENTKFHDSISQDEVLKKQKEHDLLLFVESLEKKYKNVARLSFSTKLTDYLSSGKCIFAIGSNDIAPIEYLTAENAAIVSSSLGEIITNLKRIINNTSLINTYGRNAWECSRKNHSSDIIINKVINAIKQIK